MAISTTHLVLLPTYNTGPRLHEVVTEVLRHWQPVTVVVDGSSDGSERPLLELAKSEPALTVLLLPRNAGKGAAVLAGARAATDRGFTHALVMDADGQHPAGSIAEFMMVSKEQPRALVLGRPVFPANTPPARLHGRKLSVWLVRFELLGAGKIDPLFGFRVYPLVPLLLALGPRGSGRRYDFDTEAVVRLSWAGVPLLNRAAPVKYFSRAEGGVSHFHYGRDNATLVWMHVRLIAELLLWRWPAIHRQRRHPFLAGAVLAWVFLCARFAHGAEPDSLVNPAHRLTAAAPAWAELIAAFARNGDTMTEFTERRSFPFKKDPVELKGEVRVSASRGLSLHYTAPTERTVILDAQGMLIREASGESTSVTDSRAQVANDALREILRFDFAALEKNFDLYGERDGAGWRLVLLARSESIRRSLSAVAVEGEDATVRRIELRHSPKQSIEILNAPPHPSTAFTADEVKRFFR